VNLLAEIEALAPDLERIGSAPPPEPRWAQDWFPRLDAAAAYAMVRATRPGRIVEVGSGHSTRFLARAVRDGGLDTAVTAIDPAPRASLAGLNISFISKPVQDAGQEPFDRLESGDILFIDSSHQVKPGSDVEHLFANVIPKLAAGVRVHFHDIFLPDEYPRGWEWRRYNEQQSVARLLGGDYVQEFSSHQALKQRTAMGGLRGVLSRLPLVPGAIESSLWLRKL
jgi:hypothetical protein